MVSEYLRKSRNTNFSENKMLSNKLHRRGNGKVRIAPLIYIIKKVKKLIFSKMMKKLFLNLK